MKPKKIINRLTPNILMGMGKRLYFRELIAIITFILLPFFALPAFAASTGTFNLITGQWGIMVGGVWQVDADPTNHAAHNCAWDGNTLTVNDGADIEITGTKTSSAN